MKKSKPDKTLENLLKRRGFSFVAGVDEAGRGPLAGPVVASAVLLKESSFKNRIDDSKKLTQLQRERAFGEIFRKAHIGLGIVSEKVIDEINILNATRLAMKKAVRSLLGNKFKNICFIVDGNMKLDLKYPYESIPQADGKSISVACASIVAKVVRDKIMELYDSLSPYYEFSRHKGYGTKFHFRVLKERGPCVFHRKTFYPVNELLLGSNE